MTGNNGSTYTTSPWISLVPYSRAPMLPMQSCSHAIGAKNLKRAFMDLIHGPKLVIDDIRVSRLAK